MDRMLAREFALNELEKWELTEKGWTFSFNNALSYAGICYEDEKEIRISGPICDVETEDFIKDTILHETAHALAGNKHAHGIVWQGWARKVGCSTNATYEPSEQQKLARLAKVKYVMCFEDRVIKTYLRKPNRKTIANLPYTWLPGMKEETYGKLTVHVYNPKVHTEFLTT